MKTLYHARLYASEGDGQTHFEDVPVDLELETLASAGEVRLPCSRPMRTESLLWVDGPQDLSRRFPPGRRLLVTLKGEYQVQASDGQTRNFPAGSVLLVDNAWNGIAHPPKHSTQVISPEGVTLLSIGLRSRSHPDFGDGD